MGEVPRELFSVEELLGDCPWGTSLRECPEESLEDCPRLLLPGGKFSGECREVQGKAWELFPPWRMSLGEVSGEFRLNFRWNFCHDYRVENVGGIRIVYGSVIALSPGRPL